MRESGKQEQVGHIERVPAVRKHAGIDQRVGPHLTVLSAARDVDQADDQHAQRLPEERHADADGVHEMIGGHRTAGEAGTGAEGDRQQNDREERVANAKDEMTDARGRSLPRQSGFAASAGAHLDGFT